MVIALRHLIHILKSFIICLVTERFQFIPLWFCRRSNIQGRWHVYHCRVAYADVSSIQRPWGTNSRCPRKWSNRKYRNRSKRYRERSHEIRYKFTFYADHHILKSIRTCASLKKLLSMATLVETCHWLTAPYIALPLPAPHFKEREGLWRIAKHKKHWIKHEIKEGNSCDVIAMLAVSNRSSCIWSHREL